MNRAPLCPVPSGAHCVLFDSQALFIEQTGPAEEFSLIFEVFSLFSHSPSLLHLEFLNSSLVSEMPIFSGCLYSSEVALLAGLGGDS